MLQSFPSRLVSCANKMDALLSKFSRKCSNELLNSASVTTNSQPTIESWAPYQPDIRREDIIRDNKTLEVLAIGGMGYVYKYKGLAFKLNCFQRELSMMQMAGDCSVRAVARVVDTCSGQLVTNGLLMELQTTLDIKRVEHHKKAEVKDEMISLVRTLHEKYRMVHGDIKPLNMLRCSDGKIRLCDFDSARPIDEAPEAWEGLSTEQFLAPNRDFFNTGAPPTPSDDIYALGLSIWELYTGKEVFADELDHMEEISKERRTVDVMEVEDQDVRELICGFLRQGGAMV